MRRIGVLTSGGDSPGMNAAVMAVAKSARYYGMSLIGIKRGYNGTLCKSHHIEDDMVELDLDTILDIADQPGTYLRTARCLDFLRPEMRVHAANNIREMGIEGIVVIGGDGSYHGAMGLCELGIPCVGIPGTIDNDLAYTEMTLGYDTAVNSCIDDIRSIRATSRSHDRPGVVEVMGRHCGDIALKAAAGSGAEICLVPEVSWSIQEAADRLSRLIDMGNPCSAIPSAAARRPLTTAGLPLKRATSPSICSATASVIRSSALRMAASITCPSPKPSSRSVSLTFPCII